MNRHIPIAKSLTFRRNPNNEQKFTGYVHDDQNREIAILFLNYEDMEQLETNIGRVIDGIQEPQEGA